MTTFDNVLLDIADYLRVPADVLAVCADEYPFAAVPFGVFPHGGITPGEGRLLWTLVRAQKPGAALEIGTHSGGSATIIAMALRRNGRGFLDCLDIDPNAGWLIPDSLHSVIRLQTADADLWIQQAPVAAYDFVFEDGAHSEHQVHTLYANRDKFLKPDGLMLSHDALVEGVGDYVRNGLRKGGALGAQCYAIEDSPLGISLYCPGTFTPPLLLADVPESKPKTSQSVVRRRKKARNAR